MAGRVAMMGNALKWAGIILIVGYFVQQSIGGGSGPSVGASAPTFTAPTLEGEDFELAEHQGQVVVMDFWATWCRPCMVSLPVLQKLHDRYADDENVMIVSINTNHEKNIRQVLNNFMGRRKFDFPVILDRTSPSVSQIYKVQSIPTLVIVKPNGEVYNVAVGLSTSDTQRLETEIVEMIEAAKGDG